MTKLGDKIRELREALEWSQGELAARTPYSQQAIDKIENGGTRRPRNIDAIERALGTADGELRKLMPPESAQRAPRKNRRVARAHMGGPFYVSPDGKQLIPVMGRAAAGDTSRIIMSSEPVMLLPCPPDLAGVPDAYSLFVHGDSMVPRFLPGERIYVHPVHGYSKDDYCVIQIGDPDEPPEAGYIKQFDRWEGDDLVVKQLNPEREIRFPAKRVQSIHVIMGTWRG